MALRILDDADDDGGAPLFAVATTAYILLAIQFEERDLVREFGRTYEDYRRQVPMLVPFTGRKRRDTVGERHRAAV